MVSANANETMISNSPPVSQRYSGRQKYAMNSSCEDLADATPLKKKLAALYDNSSANGGDPTLSAHGGRSSKRST